ncbi:MAG: hypothetical protein ACLGIJ_12730 [Candidatus Limnocylindria bacterium]
MSEPTGADADVLTATLAGAARRAAVARLEPVVGRPVLTAIAEAVSPPPGGLRGSGRG